MRFFSSIFRKPSRACRRARRSVDRWFHARGSSRFSSVLLVVVVVDGRARLRRCRRKAREVVAAATTTRDGVVWCVYGQTVTR